MTTEPTPPQENASSSPANPNGPRQKQSFRRRRKRRGPGANPSQQPAPNGAQNGSSPQNGADASPPGSATPRNDNRQRKPKKRFFKKNQGQGAGQKQNQGANPGQGQPNGRAPRGNGQQQRRSSKQRRPKVFVGPMDHSYRAGNGNYAEGPPSTIELQQPRGYSGHYNGNGNVNGNIGGTHAGMPLELMEASGGGSAPANDGPARIYCFIDDLFFMAKIQETSRKLGIKVSFVKNEKETIAQMLALPEAERPTLIVIDLNNANAKPLTLIPKLKLKLKRATSIVGFLSHLQGELKAKAIEAGCDAVMPRSAFSQTLPNLLRRYGLEVEEDLTQMAGA
ncbi:MAG: response regulator [Acidobacteriaceae bacterium]